MKKFLKIIKRYYEANFTDKPLWYWKNKKSKIKHLQYHEAKEFQKRFGGHIYIIKVN